MKYLYTPAAQRIFADNGYRPVVRSALNGYSFAVRPEMFTIDYLGGWAKVDKRFFDPKSSDHGGDHRQPGLGLGGSRARGL